MLSTSWFAMIVLNGRFEYAQITHDDGRRLSS